jgi:acyl-CoA hydrolase
MARLPVGQPVSVSESQTALVKWMGLTDANSAGFIHGGMVMKLCDEAAGLAAMKHSRRRVVTAAMDRMTFLLPIHVGEVLTLRASVNAVWRTSMEVGVRVDAENPRTGVVRHTNSAYLTFVALDDDGQPAEVRALRLETPTEERREREAQLRRANRLAERARIVDERREKGEGT